MKSDFIILSKASICYDISCGLVYVWISTEVT